MCIELLHAQTFGARDMLLRSAIYALLPALLASCCSLAVVRYDVDLIVDSGGKSASQRLYVWVVDAGLVEEYSPSVRLLASLTLFPLNSLLGVIAVVGAPFDDKYEIRYGPLGAILGVAVPGFTLVASPKRPTGTVWISPREMMVLRSKPLDGQEKHLLRLVASDPWLANKEVVRISWPGQ